MADLVFLDPRRRPRPLLRSLVGDVLRRHRLRQSRTLADVARSARVSMPYLSEVERGLKEASSEVLAAVCAALHIDLSDLLAEVWQVLAAEPGPRHHDPAGGPAPAWRRLVSEPVPAPRRAAPARRPGRGSSDVVLLAA